MAVLKMKPVWVCENAWFSWQPKIVSEDDQEIPQSQTADKMRFSCGGMYLQIRSYLNYF